MRNADTSCGWIKNYVSERGHFVLLYTYHVHLYILYTYNIYYVYIGSVDYGIGKIGETSMIRKIYYDMVFAVLRFRPSHSIYYTYNEQ
jgi:hypothetical protein